MAKRLFSLSLLLMLIISCSPTTQQPSDDPTAKVSTPLPPPTTEPPSPTPPRVVTATPPPTSLPAPLPLSAEGPWWIFATAEGIWADGLWAVNPDGTGLTQLVDQGFVTPRNISMQVSPRDGWLALLTADDFQYRGLTLNLVQIPTGAIQPITPLSSPETEPGPNADPALRPPEPLLAITQANSLAWSPDGRSLAFLGAFEGPSSDLYVYSLDDGSITRLTDGPTEAIRPIWSPDGKYILHFGVLNLGTGAGFNMAGVWAARADNSGVITLYDPSESGEEVVIGWLAEGTFVVHSIDVGRGGPANLRTVNIDTGEITTLWKGPFRDVALDPETGNMLVLIDENSAQIDPATAVGVYHMRPDSTSVRVLSEEPIQAVWSTAAGLFFARTEFGIAAITANGDWNQLHDFTGQLPVSSPIEKELAWFGAEGFWIGNLISSIDLPQPLQVFTGPVSYATWDPQGQHVLFFSNGSLYVVSKPDLVPKLVAEELFSSSYVWINPDQGLP